MGNWRSSILQVIRAEDRKLLGTAFGIYGRRILTCRHVLLGQDRVPLTLREQQTVFKCPSIFLFNSVEVGPVAVAEWAFHEQYDVACGYLAEGAPAAELPVQVSLVPPSTTVVCAGFPASGPDRLHSFERKVAAGQGVEGLVLDGALAPGMSGGPALVDGRAIGVVYADAASDNMAYLAPLNTIFRWMERLFPPMDSTGAPSGGIASVPVAGTLRFFDVPPAVIEIFARQFEEQELARTFFRDAMALRAAHNPEGFTDRQIIVRPAEIVWSAPPEARWMRIFELCGKRSQRTVAALFFAVDAPQPEFLAPPERELFQQFKAKLMY
ncbi:trypsin-like peptidase domain-containing protein [Rhizobium laguerreae]|uniref:S1 family peptidase n=1 Tax=Rhizobium laguerreae TaxID=1076926 RepID=UPI001C925BED|nr:serine protease [Rhizobium laguerreae]MBY3214300.1 trypsin-like peptidase domain-containing protein [Rhizobium laguerreae]